MLILDTHIWVCWNQCDSRLKPEQLACIENERLRGIAIPTISLVEISRLVQPGRLVLPKPVDEWFDIALAQEGVILIPITPAIAIDAADLPGSFHKDPADRLIVATARTYDAPLLTADREILKYPFVKLA